MLAIVTSHPIQYQAPLWRAFASDGRVPFEVWFLTPHAVRPSHDREFGRTFAWDLDLLSGYPNRFLDIADGWRLDRFQGIRLRRSWTQELRARKATALWVEGWRFLTLWQAVRAAHALDIPVWLRGESHDLAPETAARRLAKRVALGWLFRRIDRFLCIGSANRRFYRGYGVPAEKFTTAPYCIDTARYVAEAADLRPHRTEIRRKWEMADHAYGVLFCGKLIPKKRPLDLIAAARRLPHLAGRPLHLLFAGDGDLADQIRAELTVPGAPRGTVTGFLNQTEIAAAYVAADCLVLPSDYGETWGLVVNEALATGLPAIVSNHCGCAEDLAAPQGLPHVFPCNDIASLAASLQHVAAHPPSPDLLRALSETHAPAQTVESVAELMARTSRPLIHACF
jgi:glycosyltransferase involved in cell wall biosynthesis